MKKSIVLALFGLVFAIALAAPPKGSRGCSGRNWSRSPGLRIWIWICTRTTATTAIRTTTPTVRLSVLRLWVLSVLWRILGWLGLGWPSPFQRFR